MPEVENKTRILILYANYGEGHKRAAQALAESVREQLPEATVLVKDFLGQAFPISDWVMRKLYLQTYHRFKSIYGFLYYKTKDLPADAPLFRAFSYFGYAKLERFIEKLAPTIIISTFPSLTGMLAVVKEKGRRRVPFSLWCVLTDYVAHSQWLYKAVDRYMVPNDEIRADLLKHGIEPHTITTTGIPVSSAFYQKGDRASLLQKYGLRENIRTVLVSAGAFGVINLAEVCDRLAKGCSNTQFVVVCGRNQKLYHRIQSIRNAGLDSIHPLPFVQEMQELLQLADLFITKAGGLSVSEALTLQVPMILFGSLPGQEVENAKFLVKSDVARSAATIEELMRAVQTVLAQPGRLQMMQANLSDLQLSIAPARKIAGMLATTLEHELKPQAVIAYKPHQLSARGEVF